MDVNVVAVAMFSTRPWIQEAMDLKVAAMDLTGATMDGMALTCPWI